MGLMTGGIIMKNVKINGITEILNILGIENHPLNQQYTMEEITSVLFENIGIVQTFGLWLIVGKYIPLSNSFDNEEHSVLDDQLELLTRKGGEILCYQIHSVADSYGWSYFTEGRKIKAKSKSGKIETEFGTPIDIEKNIEMDEDGIMDLIKNFTNIYFDDLFFNNKAQVIAFHYK